MVKSNNIDYTKKIYTYTLEHKFIKEYENARVAEKELRERKLVVTSSNILDVCYLKRKSLYGIIFSFTKLEQNQDNIIPKDGKVIPGFPDYLVCPSGRIFNKKRCYYMDGYKKCNGMHLIELSNEKTTKTFQISYLVAKEFIVNTNNYNCIIHLNDNYSDNNVSNLQWSKWTDVKKKIIEIEILKYDFGNEVIDNYEYTNYDDKKSNEVYEYNLDNDDDDNDFCHVSKKNKILKSDRRNKLQRFF